MVDNLTQRSSVHPNLKKQIERIQTMATQKKESADSIPENANVSKHKEDAKKVFYKEKLKMHKRKKFC